jgi:hypothetical protein
MLREKHDVRHAINELHKLLPRDIASTEQATTPSSLPQ